MLSVGPHLLWGGFAALLAGCLAVDVCAHRRPREAALGDALRWTAIWVGLAGVCAAAVWLLLGSRAFLQFAAAYTVEWSLSADNALALAAVMAGLALPARHRHAVLLYGTLGAITMRLASILAGSALLGRYGWLTCVLGALLLVAAVRLLREPARRSRPPGLGPPLRGLPAPPLVLAALAVAVTDLAFAADSIPAVFAMTRDPFIAFASNAMAAVGLRSIYVGLAAAALHVRYLRPALVALLTFVGVEMLAGPLVHVDVPPGVSLAAILVVLGAAGLANRLRPRGGSGSGSAPDPEAPVAHSTASNF